MSKTVDKSYRRSLHTVLHNRIPQDVIDKGNQKRTLEKEKWVWKYGYNKEYDVVVISKDGTVGQIIEINGLAIALPKAPKNIRFANHANKVQKWQRYSVPDDLAFFDKIYKDEDDTAAKENEVFAKHENFIDADFNRKFNGDWFMCDGEPVYITGHYYFFLQHYVHVNNKYGDFRMPQRDYFIWIEACFADERCIGSLLLKSRRSGFSVTSSCIIINQSITHKNGVFPIVSKTEKDAKKLFQKHIVRPFLLLPKHFQPQRTGEVAPVDKLLFSSPKKKLTTNNKSDSSVEGLDTIIEVFPTTNAAYDGNEVTISLNDEISKTDKKINFDDYWDVHHKFCHIVGDEIVGKALCGSTASSPNKGGRDYEKFCEDSKLHKRSLTGQTPTELYFIFIPADLSTAGYFDEWGYPIYGNPEVPILNEKGKFRDIGVKDYLDNKEAACGDDVKKLNSRKRSEPRNENDPFLDEDATNMYATTGLVNLKTYIKTNINEPEYKSQLFRFDLFYKNGIDGEVVLKRNDASGRFLGSSNLPIPLEFRNKHGDRNGKLTPLNGHLAAFGADPYQADRTKFGTGSKQGLVGVTTDYHDLNEVDQNKVFLYYNYRPNIIDEAEEDIIKACLYFSIPILPENNKDGLVKKFYKRDLRNFVLNNPLKKKADLTPNEERYGGIYTSNANVDKQESSLETYIYTHIADTVDDPKNIKVPFLELLEQAESYTGETLNRRKSDAVVAWQLACLATNRKIKKPEPIIVENTSDESLLALFETPTNFN